MARAITVLAGNGQWVWLLLLGLGGVLLGACVESGSPPITDAPRPPAWLDTMPPSKDDLCAIGVSGPTYYPQDALANSKANALTQLARAVKVKITSEMTVHEKADGMGRSEISVEELSGFMSDVVLKFAQVREQWVNPGGYATRGEKGSAYTLMCMPLNVTVAEMEENAKGQIPVSNPHLPLLRQRTEEVMREWRR
jgi:hypothetical protein